MYNQKTILKQYFTDAQEVNSAMVELLGDVDNLTLLEPSVGNGALLSGLKGSPQHIDAVDVDPTVLDFTKKRHADKNIDVHCIDFVDYFIDKAGLSNSSRLRPDYDAVISNPPFGLYFSREYRQRLKLSFPHLYVRESYGLFLAFSISLLREEGRYVFLLPDTFLTSTNHSSLRRLIINSGDPSHIIRFSSKRFETVNFGYGNLCIIAGHKRRASKNKILTWVEAFDADLPLLQQPGEKIFSVPCADLYDHVNTGWCIGMGEVRSEILHWTTLGEVADCKTGIYTGDNGRFIGYDPSRINKRLNGHPIDWGAVCMSPLTSDQRTHGLEEQEVYVPIIRGGHRSFAEKTAWAIRWNRESVHFYRTDKKARLQNSLYYFRSGLAVPMVTSRRLSASLMDNAVFDQGVVGVFPANANARDALLLYLNSSIASELRNKLVNGSANNSANYLKRLPVPQFNENDCAEASAIVSNYLDKGALPLQVCDDFISGFVTMQDMQLNLSAAT